MNKYRIFYTTHLKDPTLDDSKEYMLLVDVIHTKSIVDYTMFKIHPDSYVYPILTRIKHLWYRVKYEWT